MKLALNAKSACALRELADALPKVAVDITEGTAKMITVFQSVSGGLGIHQNAFYEMLLHIKKAQTVSSEALEILPAKMRETADQIDAYVAKAHKVAPSEIAEKQNDVISAALTDNGFSHRADFGNLDSRTSRDIFLAVAEAKQMFPELDLQFVGSAQARNKAIEDDLRREYLSAYRKCYPGADDAEFMPYIDQQVAEDMKCLTIEDDTIAQSLSVLATTSRTGNIMAHYNGISINEAYGSSYEHFIQVKQADTAAGWKPVNCGTPKATVDHELGHQIAKLTDAHNNPEIKELFDQFSKLEPQDRSKILSGYAGTNIHEFIAESWSEYRNNPQCRDCAKFVAEKMIELYEAPKPVKKKVLRRSG